VKLDDPIDSTLPELASQSIVKQNEDGTFDSRPAKKSITLRHLLTHSAGTTYPMIDPTLLAWRKSPGAVPVGTSPPDGDVATSFAYPRTYEAGESWNYGGSLDWASLLVARLTHQAFGIYVEDNIAKPLGITTFTWHLPLKPDVERRLMTMSVRKEDGTLIQGQTPFAPDPVAEG
jgi:CubicO group peptidase (beta-lactamase class C family)